MNESITSRFVRYFQKQYHVPEELSRRVINQYGVAACISQPQLLNLSEEQKADHLRRIEICREFSGLQLQERGETIWQRS